ncbi:HIT family protein [Niallia taxi]|nr:HIT family protein [Niallia taxi]MDE5050828.1 HIT family protein [Niallia taxi]
MTCIGCDLAHKKLPVHVVFENDFVCCILDHDPYNEGHDLILTKKHFEDMDELDAETASYCFQAARVISKAVKTLYKPDGITICQNGGVFSELSHFHMHIVPRYKQQAFAAFYLDDPFNNANLRNKLLKTQTDLKAAIQEINELV